MMISRAFYIHGRFCASHPWEVIVGTITLLVIMSMSAFSSEKICGYNYSCPEQKTDNDAFILTSTKCLAVVYIYLQFRNLKKIGSKYILGIALLFTVFSSFVFSTAVLNLVKSDITGLNEALPFFLLLVDLGKASALARFALTASSKSEVRENIARGMAVIGPTISLDALVETLVIGVGTLSGIKHLELICCFGCMSVIANYLVFMTFFPACLALVLELAERPGEGRPVWHLQQMALKHLSEEEEQKPNPVVQRVKLIMCAGSVLVHLHSRLRASDPVEDSPSEISESGDLLAMEGSRIIPASQPYWYFLATKWFMSSVEPEQLLVLGLALALSIKYMLLDGDNTDVDIHTLQTQTSGNKDAETKDVIDGTVSTNSAIPEEQEKRRPAAIPSVFIIGDDSDDEKEYAEAETQTESSMSGPAFVRMVSVPSPSPPRPLQDCLRLYNEEGAKVLTDDEVIMLVSQRHIRAHELEKSLEDNERGVLIRRRIITEAVASSNALKSLPFLNYDYSFITDACCENVLGYMPVPVGVVGPLLVDGKKYYVPMATTEGCLVASTNRGCRALTAGGGVTTVVVADKITRAPVVRMPSARQAAELKLWLDQEGNFSLVKEAFDATSRFARLERLTVNVAGKLVFIRFQSSSGDAMGMNMITKGSERAVKFIQEDFFPEMEIVSISGNFCTDKKPSAVNWIEGRGKTVVSEAIVPGKVLKECLKTSVDAVVDLNVSKNLVGSAMAGSIGGCNAHASNIVSAIFIATGQDPAQNIESSNCITLLEPTGENGQDLHISCTMPCIEVGTIGGGTILPAQASCLKLLGVSGGCREDPGKHSGMLARIIAATVLAGELNLISALAAGHLVKSHMKYNRSNISIAGGLANVAGAFNSKS